jgi:hypothetical protein
MRIIGASKKGWKPILHCTPDCQAISQGHPSLCRLSMTTTNILADRKVTNRDQS